MKNDTLQQLLAKYRQGTLSQDELEQLNGLTHKDDVMKAATSRARTVMVRRIFRDAGLATVAIAACGAGVWAFALRSTPVVAGIDKEDIAAVEASVPTEDVAPVTDEVEPMMVAGKDVHHATAKKDAPPATNGSVADGTPSSQHEEPTVICNNQCDADSVINDIWKFLTA